MKERSKSCNNSIKRYLLIFFSVNLIGIAVALFLKSGLGCDTIGIYCEGISKYLSVSFGIGCFIYNMLVIIVAFIVGRKNLGMGTVVYGLTSGLFIDIYQSVFDKIFPSEINLTLGVIIFVIGQFSLSAAFAVLIQLKLGMTALDALLIKMQEKTGFSYTILKGAADVMFVISGTMLGGTFGIGTVVSTVVTGMLVTKIAKAIERVQMKFNIIQKGVVLDGEV